MNAINRFSYFIGLLLSAQSVMALDEIEVATLNQYLGADLAPVLSAPPGEEFNKALVSVLEKIAKTDFPSRAREQANLFSKRKPHIIALQEVWSFNCLDITPVEDDQGCNDPRIKNAFNDHLTLTLSELNTPDNELYQVAGTVNNLDLNKLTLPGAPFPGIPFTLVDSYGTAHVAMLTAIDRDVILSRKDVVTEKVTVNCAKPSVDGCNYETVASLAELGIDIERGFVAIDAFVDDKTHRIFNTHLEVKWEDVGNNPAFAFYQSSQANELLQTIDAITPPERSVIVLGDMNSSPTQAEVPGLIKPYQQFIDWGYYDVWTLRPGNVPGYTCCQTEELANRQSQLVERIDMIFTRYQPNKVKQARVLGDKVSSKTHPPGQGLWTTDHGGIAALLQF